MKPGKPVALVTGASSGVGATFARKLATRGYDLVLVARRRGRMEELAGELAKHGAGAELLAADLTSEADLRAVAQRIGELDRLELLVNNAGFGTRGRFFEIEVDTQDAMHRLHVLATLRLTHAALQGMVARNRGAVINVSSVAGFWESPGSVSYSSTKRWINHFTEGLYLELRGSGSAVKMQALCPGFTYSEFHEVMGADPKVVPEGWWLKAEDVVEASLQGLDEGRLFVVPGRRYRIIVLLSRLLPRAVRHFGMVRYARRMKREAPAADRGV
jgi:short-subunit dehydrogenase